MDLILYWSVRKREIQRKSFRFFLHIVFVICSVGVILLPLFFQDDFKLIKPHEYFFFGYQNNISHINWIAVLFIFIFIIGTSDYIFVNIKRSLEPSPKDIGSMLEKTAQVHLESGILCTNSLASSFELAKTNYIKKAKKLLNLQLQKLLDSIDSIVKNHMDTVEINDCITSNLMVTLTRKNFDDGRKWNPLEKKLKSENLYEDGCDSKDYITTWMRLVIQSHNSLESFKLNQIAFRIHKQPTLALPGAGSAYYNGLHYIQNDNLDLLISAINDIMRIQWPASIPHSIRKNAIKHFNDIKIKSFISIPLVRLDEVVGILNVNSSNYYLAGYSDQQRSVMGSLIFPCIPHLANMLKNWRELEYGK